MSQSAPGWYQDHDDPRLARWWDGERWTEHTLVLDEQDWSTEPAPPAALAGETAVEAAIPSGYEEDIYAPIRDPWGDEPAAPATTTAAWGATAAATPTTVAEPSWAANGGTGWSDEPYDRASGRGGFVDGLPTWAKVGLPIGVLLVVVLAFAAFGLGGGGDDGDQVGTGGSSSTTSTSRANLGDAADAALARAGTGPFTRSTFTTLIQLACTAAENDDAAALTQRVSQLGYDAATLAKLMDGLEVGTEAYCPDDMAGAPTLLAEVESAAGTGVTSSTTGVTVGETTSTTRGSTTATTKKPKPTTTTTAKATTTTTAPTTTTTAPTTTTTAEPTTTTTDCAPNCDG